MSTKKFTDANGWHTKEKNWRELIIPFDSSRNPRINFYPNCTEPTRYVENKHDFSKTCY